MKQSDYILEIKNMNKSFGVTQALKNVSFGVKRGKILGLIGENGSGKSTATSIIAGLQSADSGEMLLEGEPYRPKNSSEAIGHGICMILQEKGTFDQLSVANNIFLGEEERFISHGFLNRKRMYREAQDILDGIQASHVQARQTAGMLTFEDRKLVEVARAMYNEPRILVIDETTTALSRNGRDILYGIMKQMRDAGKSVIFISHDLDEIMQQCDEVTILRDGVCISTVEKKDYEPSSLRRMMVGREISDNYYRLDMESCKNDEVVLSMDHVYYQELKDISFKLHRGEILGFGGLGDCGMHLLGKLAFGLSEPDSGEVKTGDGTRIRDAAAAMKKRIAYISKNRDQETLMPSCSIRDNICLASYPKVAKGPFVLRNDEDRFMKGASEGLDIKMNSYDQYVMELSGGNKQKVALAKWLGFGADLFILDCPTRGIDIGVKANIYQLMMELRRENKSIIMISEEMTEIIGMCDRVIILKEGCMNGEFLREESITEEKLIECMV